MKPGASKRRRGGAPRGAPNRVLESRAASHAASHAVSPRTRGSSTQSRLAPGAVDARQRRAPCVTDTRSDIEPTGSD
ncbi:hypothetical protein AQ794_30030 [Burkholderia pseudomallei]|nr:hypothetical protein A7U58_23495 [Burkholderia pseudomallei]PNX05493.1 hypothetical protein CF649_05690 [Burkholderia sp. 136(2017)]PNX17945.1 hypothetical protein CF650_00805 [Burkholderia sp. 129]PNX32396.1 hypothetical protein CF647_05595 [Burkholderia sp. 117]PNX41352.1 hypothetical protein CF648_05685 [Burkholderia sp. 137]